MLAQLRRSRSSSNVVGRLEEIVVLFFNDCSRRVMPVPKRCASICIVTELGVE